MRAGWSLSYLSWVLWHLGYPDQSLLRCQEAIRLARTLDHPVSLAAALLYASRGHSIRRDGQGVKEYAEAGIGIATDRGFPNFVSLGTIQLAVAMVLQGQGQAALALLTKEIANHRASGAELDQPRMLAALAEAHASAGDTEAALATLADGLAAVQRGSERGLEPELHRLRGALLTEAGRMPEAEACYVEALAVARTQQGRSLELRAAVSLSQLWQQQGKRDQARQLLGDIYAWFTQGFDTPDLLAAKGLLDSLS